MVRFDYLEPTTLAEAVQLLDAHWGEVKVLAGGTDLLPRLKQRALRPRYVMNLKRIPGLDGLSYHSRRGLAIGALATVRALETFPAVREHYRPLGEAAGLLGSVQVRHLATVGGNLCNAAPSAELAPALLALGAQVRIVGPQGERTLPLEAFFRGPGETALGQGELLVEVRVPLLPRGSGGAYLKLSPRGAMDIAVVGVAAIVALEAGHCRECRIALGAVAPTPLRARSAEAALRGQPIAPERLAEAGQRAISEARPISDVRGSAEYRREMVGVLTRRALHQAAERAT